MKESELAGMSLKNQELYAALRQLKSENALLKREKHKLSEDLPDIRAQIGDMTEAVRKFDYALDQTNEVHVMMYYLCIIHYGAAAKEIGAEHLKLNVLAGIETKKEG